jgi:2-polyprenyl-3-methyl-5-hydroxy-6-metoxy-1,4-benzoquinol methylase
VYVEDWILQRTRERSVLHLGCAGDFLSAGRDACLHVQISRCAKELWGVELDPDALGQVMDWLPEDPEAGIRYSRGDVEDLESLEIDRTFDTVLVGSIIEHLANPGRMLVGVRKHVSPDGRVLLVTPHVFGLLQFLRVAFRKTEAVHPQHTSWYSISTLTEMCRRHGLEPVEWFTGYSYRRPSWTVSLKRAVGVPFFRLFPHLGGSLLGVFKPC